MNNKTPSHFSIVLVFILFALMTFTTVLFQPLEKAVAFSATDDGLYYPVLAQNMTKGGGCSYDGVSTTNGFHPLWLLTLLPIFGLFADPWLALKTVYVLVFSLQLTAIGVFALIARKLKMSSVGWIAAMCIMVLNIRSFTIFFSMLESPLILLCYLVYLFHCLRTDRSRFERSGPSFVAGVLIGVCFLARLDAFLLAFAYGLVWGIRSFRHWTGWRAPLFSSMGCLIFVVPYLLWNRIGFGHFKSVSSWQKMAEFSPTGSWRIISSWCLHQFIPRVQYVLGLESISAPFLLMLMALVGFIGLVFALTGERRIRLVSKLSFCPEFPVFVILHALFIALFAPLDAAASAWYWVPEILLTALVAGACLPEMRFSVLPSLAILLVVVQLLFYPKFLARKSMSFAKLEVAEYLRDNTALDARGAMFDSGIISYFSQRDFIGLNGLIGDFELANLVREKQYSSIADKYAVDFLVLDSPEELCHEFSSNILYSSEIKTKFENFSEVPKPFVVYKGTPQELAAIWNVRYQGRR